MYTTKTTIPTGCKDCALLSGSCSCYGCSCNHPEATPELQDYLDYSPPEEIPPLCPLREQSILVTLKEDL